MIQSLAMAVYITLFVYMRHFTEILAINVAMNKAGGLCNKQDFPAKIFNGDLKIHSKFEIDELCNNTIFFDVDLGDLYFVHYVVVYVGNDNMLTNFDVYLKSFLSATVCSEYSNSRSININRLRVNCKASSQTYSNVYFESKDFVKTFSVAEIEVHTLASGQPEQGVLIRRGCLKKFQGVTLTIEASSLYGCQEGCSNAGYIYAGIKNNRTCHCGGDYDDLDILDDSCQIRCDHNAYHCGGNKTYSVYLVLPTLPRYKGCYAVNSDGHANVTSDINMTISKCLRLCDKYFYASLWQGNRCICSNSSEETTNKYSCNDKCTGDWLSLCGGSGHASVYETCLKDYINSTSCSKLLRCSLYNMYGACNEDCYEGYDGQYCLERIDTQINPVIDFEASDVVFFAVMLFCLGLVGYFILCIIPSRSLIFNLKSDMSSVDESSSFTYSGASFSFDNSRGQTPHTLTHASFATIDSKVKTATAPPN